MMVGEGRVIDRGVIVGVSNYDTKSFEECSMNSNSAKCILGGRVR